MEETSTYEPPRIEVPWDGEDLELKLMGAIFAAYDMAIFNGMDEAQAGRVAAYFAMRYAPIPPIRTP